MLKALSKFSGANIRSLFKAQSALKQLVVRGLFWSLAAYGLATGMRLGSSLVLTRLLSPDLFGLMSLIYVFIVGLHLFTDLGFGPNIVRSEQGDDPDLLNTAWTIQIIRGVVIWLVLILLTVPLSKFYNDPQLVWLLPIVGLGSVFSSFASTSVHTLVRHMEVGKLTRFDLQNQVISIATQIAFAWLYRNIWALVIGNILPELIKVIWSHFLIPNYRNRLAWNPEMAKEIFSFGRWIFLSTMLTFLAGQVDRLTLGKLLSFHFLGVYGVVSVLAGLPATIAAIIASRVIFPAVSKLTHLPREALRSKLLQNRKPALILLALGLALLVSFGDVVVSILYDKRYAEATWMLPLVALGIWPNALVQTSTPILLSVGKPQYEAYGNLLKLLFTGIGIPLSFKFLGFPGTILVIALNDLPSYGAIAYGLQREGLTNLGQDLQLTLLLLAALAIVLTSRFALGFGLPISGIFSSLT